MSRVRPQPVIHGCPPGHRDFLAAGYTAFASPKMVRIAVITWTVNDVPTVAALLDLGVDGIITDTPDRARWLFERRRLPLPAAYSAR